MLTYNGKPSAVIQLQDLLNAPPRLVLLDCRIFDDYDFCHLEGAIHADPESMLSSASDPGHDPAKGGRNPLPQIETWEKQLRQWGIQPDSFVVAYDDTFGAEAATRAWWMLTASGIRAAVLDGGWDAVMKARFSVTEDVIKPEPSAFKFTKWSLPTVDMETVDAVRLAPDWLLLDSRAPERWRGEVEHKDPIAGCIPGSKNVWFKENLNDGFFKSPEELRKMYLEILGTIPTNRVIASCGSGMTACHTLLALYQAGLEGAHLYAGSFSEWCRNYFQQT